FDRVTCRLGVMFFWDCRRALGELRRVLKPGGLASFIAWGPVEQNEYMRTVMGPFKKRQPPPSPAPDAPQPHRFGTPASLPAVRAGLAGPPRRRAAVRRLPRRLGRNAPRARDLAGNARRVVDPHLRSVGPDAALF